MSDNQSNNDYIPSKADYLKAKEVVSKYLKQQSERPKRKCSEKQLELQEELRIRSFQRNNIRT